MKAVIVITVVLVSLLGTFQAISADDLFYSGDVVTESLGINIDIDDEEATVTAVYLLNNLGSETEEINLQCDYSTALFQIDGETLENPVVFNPGDRKSVTATFKLDITGETTRTLYLVPDLLFDGSPNSEPAAVIMIKALLPEGVNGLAWASHEPDEESLESGRKRYSWTYFDVYPTPLTLKWSTLGVDLSLEKSASPVEVTQPDQVISIEITLKNNGDMELVDIQLVDQYSASHFAEIEPSTESGTRENILFWQKTIDSLSPGETMSLHYSVTYIAPITQDYELDLKPTVVTVGGNLVLVSNKVRMEISTEPHASTPEPQATAEPEKSPGREEGTLEDSSWPLKSGIVVPVLLIMAGAVYFFRKRRRAE
ncbi:MAG: hypothetical protein JSW38_01850 [Dehalococcoidia bacterium]|nr:MAG: hypothetical protein JSW38_01850 [Dehalococcoidia bacterium]